MRESNECFSDSVKEISKSITELSIGLYSSMEMQQQPMHQSLFYQNVGGIQHLVIIPICFIRMIVQK